MLRSWPLGLAEAEVGLAQLPVQTHGLGLELGYVCGCHSDPAVQLLGFGAVPAPSALRRFVEAAHDLLGRVVPLHESSELGQALFAEEQKALGLIERLQAVLLPATELLQGLLGGTVEQEGFAELNIRPQGVVHLKLRLMLLQSVRQWELVIGDCSFFKQMTTLLNYWFTWSFAKAASRSATSSWEEPLRSDRRISLLWVRVSSA